MIPDTATEVPIAAATAAAAATGTSQPRRRGPLRHPLAAPLRSGSTSGGALPGGTVRATALVAARRRSSTVLICLPPPRALGWLREAGPRHRGTAAVLWVLVASGPAPAASPGNRRGRTEGVSSGLPDLTSECGERARRGGLDGPLGDAHDRGDLRLVQFEVEPEHQGFLLPGGQPSQRGQHLAMLLPEQGRGFRRLGGVPPRGTPGGPVVPGAPAAQGRTAPVEDRRPQVRQCLGRVAEPGPMPE